MSNYEIPESTSNRSHNQGNITLNFNQRAAYTCTGIANPPMADTQKLSNQHHTMPQNHQFYNYQQPFYQQPNYIIAPQQFLQFPNNPIVHNNTYSTLPSSQQFQSGMVTFNPNVNNIYQPAMDRQFYVYQSQPGPIQNQIQHSAHVQSVNMNHVPHQISTHISQQNQPQISAQQMQQQHQQHQQLQQQQQQIQQLQQMQSTQPPSQLQHMQTPPQQYQPMIHQMQHQSKPMQPQIRPQNVIFPGPSTYRSQTTPIIPTEKHTKTSSALEIINPETNECIDLNSFKSSKSKEVSKIDENQSKTTNEFAQIERPIIIDLHIQIEAEECDKHDRSSELIVDKADVDVSGEDCGEADLEEDRESIVVPNTDNDGEEHYNDFDNVDVVEGLTHNDTISNNGDADQRFIYTREDLIRIGKSALSRVKPKGLPVKDKFTDPIILEHPMNISYLNNFETIQGMNQKPSKSKKSKDENCIYDLHSINRNQQGHPNFWRHNASKNSSVPRYIDLGVPELPLMRSEDGYVTFKQRLASGEELNQTEELVRQIKGILNRIVPQNFDQCLNDLVSLKVGTHEGMTCLVNELFLKAVKEEAYSVTFAKICSYLASIKADVSENEIVTFRSVLLQKCQAMFTTPLEEQLERVRQDWLEKASAEKPKTKALMESDVEEQVKKAKDRYYGNIRFIGELYLKGVLITKIICFCIENLMSKENDSDSLICLCKLLETCGSKLETETKGKEKLNNACKTLRDFTDSQNIETRVRFRILDILEMREKKWSLRKVQQEQKIEPKTLQEIKLEKEMEDDKDYYHSLNRRNPHTWATDRRQSLPSVNKNRSSITPKQLSVNSSEPTTLGPQNRNWLHGSGYKSKCDVTDMDKRLARQRIKLGINGSDISQITENYEISVGQLNEPDVEGCLNDHLPLPCCSSPGTSSQNSSRSSSHSRSIPTVLSKEKLPDSKLATPICSELKIYSPEQLLKEHMTNNVFCEHSWNSYPDKVNVVYKWLDMNLDTNSDKRRSLSHLLTEIINQGVLDKEDLLKAFAKLLDLLEDLLIDVGQALWVSFTDYLIPFIESMDMSSIDIVENIFSTCVFQNSCLENAAIIYSLPWSMINGILKLPDTKISSNIFKLSVIYETTSDLSDCHRKLLNIIENNISKAVSIKYQMQFTDYESWFNIRMKEAVDCFARKYFSSINLTTLLRIITPNTCINEKLNLSLTMLSSLSSSAEVFHAIVNISLNDSLGVQDILCKLWYLTKSCIYDVDSIIAMWTTQSSESHTTQIPRHLTLAFEFLKSKSAFTIQSSDSFKSFFSHYCHVDNEDDNDNVDVDDDHNKDSDKCIASDSC